MSVLLCGSPFNQTPHAAGQPDGTELMGWLNHNGPVQPFGSQAGTASIGGRSYNVWFGKQAWNTVSYTMTTPATSVTNLDIGQLTADAGTSQATHAAGTQPATGTVTACKVGYTVTNSWPSGFQAQVTVTNTGKATVNGWSLGWTFPAASASASCGTVSSSSPGSGSR